MERFSQKQVWLYSRNDKVLFSGVIEDISEDNALVGITYQTSGEAVFPRSGLVPAMQAAMRGEINLLLVTDYAMLGINPAQIEDMINTFADYGVSVRSCNNSGRSIS